MVLSKYISGTIFIDDKKEDVKSLHVSSICLNSKYLLLFVTNWHII